jgi:hypothetical protein
MVTSVSFGFSRAPSDHYISKFLSPLSPFSPSTATNLLKTLQITVFHKPKLHEKWFTPVILATQEADIRRILVQGKNLVRPYLNR